MDLEIKGFASNLKRQIEEIIPSDLSKDDRTYVLDTVYNFTILAGEFVAKEESLGQDEGKYYMFSQIVAEWTYHKCLDLVHSTISRDYWNEIIQKIAYTTFEVVKDGIINEIEQQVMLENLEKQVNKTWEEDIDELVKKI